MTTNERPEYRRGDQIIYIPEGKVYDFGYYSKVIGKCVIYEPGEQNMQDSYAVNLSDIRLCGEA